MEEDQRLLVYEFMPRGSLENHLFRSMFVNQSLLINHKSYIDSCFICHCYLFVSGTLPLPWSVRMKIALGAAKGLAFLHEEAEKPVIYRDFKTSNILLDAVCLRSQELWFSLIVLPLASPLWL